jgi:ubiquinone/menaquinone biosynthesis C-methylase UbiE
MVEQSPFHKAGIASLDDLATPEWQRLFRILEAIQGEFLNANPHTPGYRWPRDPLHTCTRVWEYPFVYSYLLQLCQSAGLSRPKVVDLGSGATFFPFAIARLGCDVIALDLDLESGHSLNRGLRFVSTDGGSLQSVLGDAHNIPLHDKSVDCVYCISVLEHLPNPAVIIPEVARIIRREGFFILTFDTDLRGNSAIGPDLYTQLRQAIDGRFDNCYPERFVHPMRILTTDNSPYPYYAKLGTIAKTKRWARKCLSVLSGMLHYEDILVSTYGICLRLRNR